MLSTEGVSMQNQGYYSLPDVHDDKVIFISEDDLWQVPLKGGIARKLTDIKGKVFSARFSPDGKWIAVCASDEGYLEVYLMDALGGPLKRLTYLGGYSKPVAWSDDSLKIYITSSFKNAFGSQIYTIGLDGGEPAEVPVGHANALSYGEKGVVIARHTRDLAYWKRYRGGTAGEFWIDVKGNGDFKRLLDINSNLCSPMWIGKRIYFASDHEGIGNIYSCDFKGKDIKRHTNEAEFYARNASTDGKTIVYHAGADLFALDVATDKVHKLKLDYHSAKAQLKVKFADPHKYLQGYDLNNASTDTVLAVRGKLATMCNWSGPVRQWGKKDGTRYRIPVWLNCGKKFVAVSDEMDGEDRIIMVEPEKKKEKLFRNLELGRVWSIVPSPNEATIAITNHRNELYILNLEKASLRKIDTSDENRIFDVVWSPDGKWLAYSIADTSNTHVLRIADAKSGKKHDITSQRLYDYAPTFSEDGKYLFFAGDRIFWPEYDA
ncbi:MAG: peptidase, partial [Candidatus Cloacimonetes bacterium]|nr:peptidase [Candidatus Cloacimonadota bacterium]